MAFVQNNGVRIRYEVTGSGPPLVLQHWSLATLEEWFDLGFVDALRDEYRLILLDARGHGGSDRPHDPAAYGLSLRVSDIVAVLDDLDIPQADFFGYSMGGWIGFGVARYAPHRFRSLVIGGQHPYEQSMAPLREAITYGIEHGIDALIARWREGSGPIGEGREQRIRQFDLQALLAVAHDRPDMSSFLPSIANPCLLLVGEHDPVCPRAKAASALIPRCRFVALAGLDHGGVLDRCDLVVPEIRQFLDTRL